MPITRLHAGAVFDFPGGSGPAATIVGAPPQWDDESDATYAISETDSSGSPSFRSVVAPLDLLLGTVTADKLLSVTYHLRYSTAYPDGLPSDGRVIQYGVWEDLGGGDWARIYAPFSDGPYLPTIPDDNSIHEFTWVMWPFPVHDAYEEFVGEELVRVFKAGSFFRVSTVVPGVPQPFVQSSVTVYEAWVEVEWEGETAIRLWPRDDSLGVNSVTRVYPPPRAHRVIGGQP